MIFKNLFTLNDVKVVNTTPQHNVKNSDGQIVNGVSKLTWETV